MIHILSNNIQHHLVPTIFPDLTSQIWKLPEKLASADKVSIFWHFEQEREILDLLSLRKLLHNAVIELLHIPYLPYARQDKDVDNQSTFNFHMFADLVNLLHARKVTTMDAHNPILAKALIFNFENLNPIMFQDDAMRQFKPTTLIWPDLGARNRYLIPSKKRIVFYKHRDQSTGQITGHNVSFRDTNLGMTTHLKSEKLSDYITKDDRFLIIDDICDGGATFLSIAKTLRDAGVESEIGLCVTHGLFSKGRNILTDAGIRIFTTNSLLKNTDGYGV